MGSPNITANEINICACKMCRHFGTTVCGYGSTRSHTMAILAYQRFAGATHSNIPCIVLGTTNNANDIAKPHTHAWIMRSFPKYLDIINFAEAVLWALVFGSKDLTSRTCAWFVSCK